MQGHTETLEKQNKMVCPADQYQRHWDYTRSCQLIANQLSILFSASREPNLQWFSPTNGRHKDWGFSWSPNGYLFYAGDVSCWDVLGRQTQRDVQHFVPTDPSLVWINLEGQLFKVEVPPVIVYIHKSRGFIMLQASITA